MNVEIINPFINATINALGTMAATSPKRGVPYLKKDGEASGDISAVIGIAGEASGWVAVSFEKKAVLKVVSNMLMTEKVFIDADVRDAVGEIVNMIAGGAKGELAAKGFSFKLAIPTVIIGEMHMLSQKSSDLPCIVVPFEIPEGKFSIEICVKIDNNK